MPDCRRVQYCFASLHRSLPTQTASAASVHSAKTLVARVEDSRRRRGNGRYHSLLTSPLKSQIIGAITQAPAPSSDSGAVAPRPSAEAAAQNVLRMKEDGHCALLNSESLCTIHAQLGEAYLPGVCASYPRVQRKLGAIVKPHSRSPAPRPPTVLLSPALLSPALLSPAERSQPARLNPLPKPGLLRRRSAPQCLRSSARTISHCGSVFLLGLLCHRLDSIDAGQLRADIPDYLASFAPTRIRRVRLADGIDALRPGGPA